MSAERIISGDQTLLPHILPEFLKGWEATAVFDPNLEVAQHPSEDVMAWIIANGAALLMIVDGVSKTEGHSITGTYNSGPVAHHFVEQSFAFARPHLDAQTAFELWQMHEHAGKAIQAARSTLGDGGLVGVSALLFPDGRIQIHRFGDTEQALAMNPEKPDELVVPEALLPENRARDIYLGVKKLVAEGQATWAGPFGQTQETLFRNVLLPKGDQHILSRHASTAHGLRSEDIDFSSVIPIGGRALLGTDGLGIFSNLESFQNKGNRTLLEFLRLVYMYGKTESRDNITGLALQRKA